MTPARTFLGKLERRAATGAAVLGGCALILSFFEASWVPTAWRLAVFTCLAPALGSLILILIHRIAGGQWVTGIAPFLRAAVGLLPWIWVLALPILLMPRPPASGSKHLALGFSYEGLPFVLGRAVVIGILFFMLRRWLSDGVGDLEVPMRNRRTWVGPVGLILTFFTLTFLGDDWLESLESGWHSTAFPVIWMASQVVSGLSLALLCGLHCGTQPGAQPGAQPSRSGVAGRPLGIDWGNLLLATMMFWTYVAFCQFLIIWSGNLPEEISWYVRREAGGWKWLAPSVALFGFAVPFFLLLSRRVKRSVPGLSSVASLLLGSQWVYLVWVIVPAQGIPPFPALVMIVAASAAAAAVFINRFVRRVRLAEAIP